MQNRLWSAMALSLAAHVLLFLAPVEVHESRTETRAPSAPHHPTIEVFLPDKLREQEYMQHGADIDADKSAGEAPPSLGGEDKSTTTTTNAGSVANYLSPGELDERPHPEEPIYIPYPDASIGRGKVRAVLTLYVSPNGEVVQIDISDSNLPPAFEKSALDTFYAARMTPPIKDGRKVGARMKIEVEFQETGD